ncbi:5'-nucleotidase C-terminal domain-containing protein [Nesterenkonia xinjiangensis]|uniref:5'-nucleotidase n=1 Tax=Nesterenkonia xinjiangensis TaxID=225327 RepID=A0A7Z0GJT4_9MICC|nr:5'-nucleotidase [Nesterenkonia xinjiangensis]
MTTPTRPPVPPTPRIRSTRDIRLRGAAGLSAGLAVALLAPSSALAAPAAEDSTAGEVVELSIVGVNDLHGRLEPAGDVPGAAVLACAVDQVRTENPHTVFVSAGDNIGASTFTSFIQQDQPTLDSLAAMDLEVSVLGNHEFDAGADDVDERVLPEAGFPHIGANIRDADGEHLYEPYHLTEVAGVTIGFIGIITEDMPGLVNPAGIEGIEWTSMKEEVGRYAEQLTNGDPADGEADVVVVLAHEGLPGTDPASAQSRSFGELVDDPHPSVDAIFSGHTHQSYAHDLDGLQLVQGGEYGEQISRVDLSVDTSTGEVLVSHAETVDLVVDGAPICEPDEHVSEIVADAVEVADELGAEVVAETAGEVPFRRAVNSDGSENRGAASTVGELVADAQVWAVRQTQPDVDFAITNSGGLRADLPKGELAYRDLAAVQPFANTLVTVELTGAQVRELFEQQWREDGGFSKHAQSAEVSYVVDPEAPAGQRITEVRIDDEPVDPEATYQVAMNSYMAAGGGGVDVVLESPQAVDTGMNDLEAFVSYAAEQETLEPDLRRRAVAVSWDGDPDAVHAPGDEISLDIGGLAYSAEHVPTGETLQAELGGVDVGGFPIDLTTVDHEDLRGQAEVTVTVPEGVEAEGGIAELLLTEPVTGTELAVPIRVTEDLTTDDSADERTDDGVDVDRPEEDRPDSDDGAETPGAETEAETAEDTTSAGNLTDASGAAQTADQPGSGAPTGDAATGADAPGSSAATPGDPLASTGAPGILWLGLGALVLLAAGILLVRRGRRRLTD